LATIINEESAEYKEILKEIKKIKEAMREALQADLNLVVALARVFRANYEEHIRRM
jgi:hypothetical protein